MQNYFQTIGRISLLLAGLFKKPENNRAYWREFMLQCNNIGIRTLPIVILISFFVGAVIPIQAAYKITSAWVPKYFIGQIIRDSSMLEFSPTLTCLVLAGVVGSKYCAELGNMRISEQIDALEMMGINSKGYLILTKIAAAALLVPCLVVISIFFSMLGGYISCISSHILTQQQFYVGVTKDFTPNNLSFALIKGFSFSFVITVIPSFYGYYVEGGAIEIGRAATKAVVTSCILILFVDYILSLLLL